MRATGRSTSARSGGRTAWRSSDLVALRARWRALAERHLDARSRRAVEYCCFASLGRDLARYPRETRLRLLGELLGDDSVACKTDRLLAEEGHEAAGAFVERLFGVELAPDPPG